MEFELTKQQKEIIESPYDWVTVEASAGTSKTLLLIERIKYLVNGGADPTKIVAITFTKNAAQEIASRLGEIKIGYIGTVHALANFLLLSHGIDTSDLVEDKTFDLLFERLEDHPECLDMDISNLLLDEAQDSNYEQFTFMFDMLQPQRYMIFYDLKQSIYGFQGASPKVVDNFSKRFGVHNYYMTENFRNSEEIFRYAKQKLESATPFKENAKSTRGSVHPIEFVDYSLETIYEAISQNDKPGDWFVLAKTNAEVDEIREYLIRRGIPAESFKQGSLTNEELRKKIEDNTVKVLTVHSSKGLEAKNVVVVSFPLHKQEDHRLLYVALTRARDLLVFVKLRPGRMKRKKKNWE